MPKLTVAEFLACKGRRQLTQTFTVDPTQARAFSEAGLDVIVTVGRVLEDIRKAAPDVFLVCAGDFTEVAASDEAAIRCGMGLANRGADAVYVGAYDLMRVKAMADAAIPVIGHVGLVPYRNTWFGGMRAVGKTAEEAWEVYERTLGYENAGAIAVEMEVVPQQIAEQIARRTKMIVISMGSGDKCDGQYLYAQDMLGTNDGHVPRHAKQYRNLSAEYERIYREMVGAFGEFKADVETGAYPQDEHCVNAKPEVVQAFIEKLKQGA